MFPGRPPTATQDEGERRKKAEQGDERIMAKRIDAEKARAEMRRAVVSPTPVTGRAKERITQRKRARAGSLTLVDWPQAVRTCILWVFFLYFSFCRFFAFVEFESFRSGVLRYVRVPTATRSY